MPLDIAVIFMLVCFIIGLMMGINLGRRSF